MLVKHFPKISCISFLFLVGCQNKRFVHKKISDKIITVTWFYESYISSTRDFIEARKGSQTKIIMDMDGMIVTDVLIKSDTIIVKVFEPNNAIYNLKHRAVGYNIKLDSNVSLLEYNKYYH
jgi:hypothetical protein